MSDKVKLPREVAEAIEDLRKDHYDNRALIDEIYEGAARPVLQAYAETNFDTLLNALINGYEIEKSPEEKVREYYEGLIETKQDLSNDDYTRELAAYEASGVSKTLDLLGIKIEGVND
jgi:Protein of unknown function (DUF1642).